MLNITTDIKAIAMSLYHIASLVCLVPCPPLLAPPQNCLPPLLHLFVMPYIPSGLWTRLIARVLGDTLLMDLVVTCFKHKTPAIKSFFGTPTHNPIKCVLANAAINF